MLIKTPFASVLILAVITVGVATSSEQAFAESGSAPLSEKSQKTLDRFEATGETINCVPTRRIRSIKPLSDDLFLVRVGSSKYYLNTPTSSCSRATRDSSTINYTIDGVPNLCRGETVTVSSNNFGAAGVVFGGCALGAFEEVQEKEAQ